MSNGDPIGSEKPRGKSCAKRMGRYDGSYTPTEQRTRDRLMKQFCRDEGPPPSSAYLNAPCWCECGRLKAEGKGKCQRCLDMDAKVPPDPELAAAIEQYSEARDAGLWAMGITPDSFWERPPVDREASRANSDSRGVDVVEDDARHADALLGRLMTDLRAEQERLSEESKSLGTVPAKRRRQC